MPLLPRPARGAPAAAGAVAAVTAASEEDGMDLASTPRGASSLLPSPLSSSLPSSAASSPFPSAVSLPEMTSFGAASAAAGAAAPPPPPASMPPPPPPPPAGAAAAAAAAAASTLAAAGGGSSSSNGGLGAPSTAVVIPPPSPATVSRLPQLQKPPLPPAPPTQLPRPQQQPAVAIATAGGASSSPAKRSDGSGGSGGSETSTSGASLRSSAGGEYSIMGNGRGRRRPAVSLLAWDVSYKLRPKGGVRRRPRSKGKTVLHSIVGQAAAGDLVAVMGASGCGKSTLLKCLSLRDQGFRGGVFLNGAPVDKWYLSLVGFVDQYDLFIPTVTVREHLVFQALVRLPQGVPRRAKLARVQEVLIELNLGHVADSYIGGGKAMVRGLSGGEKRRLSFATEMLPDPHIVIADEATTGLDASMAKSVCRFLRGRADNGRIVISSIHQPSSQTFAAFTHVLLLAPQGRTAFFGPSVRLHEYLTNLGLRCPPYHNLADFAIRCVAIPPDDPTGQQTARVLELCKRYDESPLAEESRAWKAPTAPLPLLPPAHGSRSASNGNGNGGAASTMTAGTDSEVSGVARSSSFPCLSLPPGGVGAGLGIGMGKSGVVTGREYSAAWTTQFRHSLARQLQAAIRDRKMTAARMLVGVGTGAIIGMAFRGPKGAELQQGEIDNTLGFLFTVSIFSMITNFFQVAFTLPSELQVFFRERVAGVNRVSSYLLSHAMAALAFLLAWTALNVAVMFPAALNGLGFTQFAIFFATVSLSNVCSTALGYLVAVLAQNEAVALALVPALSMPMALYSGLLVNLETIPAPLQWLKHLSIIKYTLHALAQEEFTDEPQVRCPEQQGQWCKYPDWRAVLAQCSADELSLRANILALAGLSCLFLFLAYLVLLRHTMVKTVR